jgi:Tfp pilus assembly protein PilV
MVFVRVHRSEIGVSLMEVLVAMFILSVVGFAAISGVGTSVKGNDMARIRISAESLARAEIEYVSSQSYKDTDWYYTLPEGPYPTWWSASHTGLPSGYTGYSVTVSASNNIVGAKSSIQTITAVVTYSGSQVLSIVTYQSQ